MSETNTEIQLNQEQFLIANHLINNMPLKEMINLARVACVQRAQTLKDEIPEEEYKKLVENLKKQQEEEQEQEQTQQEDEIKEEDSPTIIMPK